MASRDDESTMTIVRSSGEKEQISMNLEQSLSNLKKTISKSKNLGPPIAIRHQRLFHMGRELKTGGRSLEALGVGKFGKDNCLIHVHSTVPAAPLQISLEDDNDNDDDEGDGGDGDDNDDDDVVEVMEASAASSSSRRRRRNRDAAPPPQQAQSHPASSGRREDENIVSLLDSDDDDDDDNDDDDDECVVVEGPAAKRQR